MVILYLTYFEKCYLSYQMNCVKPHNQIYLTMLHDAQILASETLFIDDSVENIESTKTRFSNLFSSRAGRFLSFVCIFVVHYRK